LRPAGSGPGAQVPVAAIDPRIRARRIEVRRGAGRRRLRRVVDVVLLALVAAGFAGALRSPLLDVEQVRVSGAHRTSSESIAKAAAVPVGTQLMDVDLGAVGRRVAALPWVRTVRLHRELGGAVDIAVTERTPAAVVGEGARAVLVDDAGRILARVADVPDQAAGLIRVEGLATNRAPGASLPASSRGALALAGRLAGAVPGQIATVAPGKELRATLVQGGEVQFGGTDHLAAKLRSLETVLARVDLTCLGVLDLRAPASPVLTRRTPCS